MNVQPPDESHGRMSSMIHTTVMHSILEVDGEMGDERGWNIDADILFWRFEKRGEVG